MISIETAKRLIKRAILANITCDKPNLSVTPLISGKHGIGKSQIVRAVADEIGGYCITIEGGTLKEGEITGLPYQYRDEQGAIKFRFLPYYAVERIQNEEKRLFEEFGRASACSSILTGDENAYSINDLSAEEKIEALLTRKVAPVILFIDEINRTENSVYKELMNILLTKSVNGYRLPWWVFFVGAMNPSTQNSLYATNEMDPAQLDRFLKLKVTDNVQEWITYGRNAGIDESILDFIEQNPGCLSESSKELDDEDKPQPSPRGWEMVDLILKSEPKLRGFFSDEENDQNAVRLDMKTIVGAKLGETVATMYFASMISPDRPILPEELFGDDSVLSKVGSAISNMPAVKKVQTCDMLLAYLKSNIEFMMLDKTGYAKKKDQLAAFVKHLDPSTQLLFAQKIASTTTDDGNNLITLLFDTFEDDLIETLDLSEAISSTVKGLRNAQ